MPTPLHNHTDASRLDGLATPEEIADRCIELGYQYVAVTDHDFVTNHINFYNKVKERNVKPVLGIETYQTFHPRQTPQHKNQSIRDEEGNKVKVDNFHLILLAMNNEGLRNLWAMNSEAHVTGHWHHGRVDWDLLERYNEGIICTSACVQGAIGQAVLNQNSYVPDVDDLVTRFLNIFGDRFYLELHTYGEMWQELLNIKLVDLAKEYSIPVVYANDAHYAYPGQYDLHETVLCMQHHQKMNELTEPHHQPDLYIMSQDEIRDRLFYLPGTTITEALDNSDEIGYKCQVTLPEHRMRVPTFIPESKWSNARDMLFDLAVEGYQQKITARGLPDEKYMPRFKHEIEIIYKAGMVDYLLMVRDIVLWAKRQGYLVGPGRGSVGGSLIAYLLGIHEVDPIRYGLIFERFYNIGRETSLPDIDIDFPTFAREPVKEYIARKYGEEYCADIGTTSTLQGRQAIQQLGKALDVPFADTKAISAIIEKAIESGQQPSWDSINEKFGHQLAPYRTKHPVLFDYAEKMYKRIYTYGVHASGYIVADEPLANNFPLRWNTKDKKPVTQWDMRTAEKLGYMKLDILGLRNLDALMQFAEEYKKISGETVDFYDVIRMDEDGELPDEMWELLDNGFTTGIFQIEDERVPRKLCKDIKPRSLEDIALITALNRPGPLKGGATAQYVKVRKGGEQITPHPIFDKVAAESYGEIIYQEQFINFFIELGYSPIEADNIRAIVGKKKRVEMEKIKPDYIERFTKLGADPKLAEGVWAALEGFADYAFNKAHSVEYGAISLWTTWAKWKNPAAFILASIKSLVAEGKKDQVPRFVREANKMGIEILRPDLNESEAQATIQGNAIRYGFNDVKGIGKTPAEWLVRNRPYVDFDDVLAKAQEPERKIRLRNGTMIVGVKANQVQALKDLATLKGAALLEAEEELLGIALSDSSGTILDEHADDIEKSCVPLEEIDEPGVYTVAGIISNIKHTKTKNGQPMAWVTLENNGIEQEFTVWSKELERLHFIWRTRQAVVANVKVSHGRDGNIYKNITGAKALHSKKSDVAYAQG